MMYAGDTLHHHIRATVTMGNVMLNHDVLDEKNILMAGDSIKATTQGRIPLKILSTTSLFL